MANTATLYIHVPGYLKAEVQRISEERSVTMSAVVVRALEHYLSEKLGVSVDPAVGLP